MNEDTFEGNDVSEHASPESSLKGDVTDHSGDSNASTPNNDHGMCSITTARSRLNQVVSTSKNHLHYYGRSRYQELAVELNNFDKFDEFAKKSAPFLCRMRFEISMKFLFTDH